MGKVETSKSQEVKISKSRNDKTLKLHKQRSELLGRTFVGDGNGGIARLESISRSRYADLVTALDGNQYTPGRKIQ